jgi:hypothetical protein
MSPLGLPTPSSSSGGMMNGLGLTGGILPPQAPLLSRRLTRRDKRKFSEMGEGADEDAPVVDSMEAFFEKEYEEKTKVKNINKIQIGVYEIDCWYYSPFPDEYRHEQKLFFCPFCLKYCRHAHTYAKHRRNCSWHHPPGQEIYRDTKNRLSVFEVDGDVFPLCTSGSGSEKRLQ